MIKVYLDAGHGGWDPGAVGNGLVEKEIALDIALRTKYKLERNGIEVMMTRTDDYTPVNGNKSADLTARCNKANSWGADAFVSIHIDAGGGTGIESFIYTGVSHSKLQDMMHMEISNVANHYGLRDRGKKKENFAVLRQTKMEAVLVEAGFIDNEHDAEIIRKDSYREDYANALAKGLCKVFNKSYDASREEVASSKGVLGRIRLHPSTDHWNIYPTNKQPIKRNAVGSLNPAKFGGLTYEILAEPYPHVFTIQSEQFGRVNIVVPNNDPDASFLS